ncbi:MULTISPECIES: NUDIX domain-containing protein [Actinomadura]|uniref:NUDIX domain-containing protein n=1 Tax=Actinomadura yumaensis TaxID=111807 RepID=A0ABW2CHF3_9ACTN|nr:NUDIX domain-containing protein [Actinomadura sp. J1-007]
MDVHVLLLDAEGRVLLMERANTGYADGRAGVPSGHLERGESVLAAAIREAEEEVAVRLRPDDLRFVHVSHRSGPGEEDRVGFFFAAARWDGEPVNNEPEKCAGIWWSDPDDLPASTVDYIADAIRRVRRDSEAFSVYGWD